MKHKNKVKRLKTGIAAFDKLPSREQAERTRPGSSKWR